MSSVPPPAPNEIIVEERIETAAEFLAALRPSDARWKPDPGEWVYRGHADSDWLLVPSQNRRSSLARYFGTTYRASDKEENPIRRRYCQPDPADVGTLMAEFVYALEKAGHVVPNASRLTEDIAENVSRGRPDVNTQEVVALAQHHGLPTYLLDWTRHSNVAAYFAASETVHLPGELAGDIEVWALKHWVGHGAAIAHIKGDEVRLWRSTPPLWGNPNMHAQGGLFTWVEHNATKGGPVYPHDKVVLTMSKTTMWARLPVMRRLKLPQSEVGALLHLLSHERVTGASLFPGVDGVVQEVRDRMHFGDELRARLRLPRRG